jgi:predicted RNA-binding protein associated with RNAse of E/G family
LRNPRRKFGKVIVANGYLAIWFIFRHRWYDIGKFYDRQGNFTGYYCDIIRPIATLLANQSKTSIITDLFLDLWIDRAGNCIVLDEDELDNAIAKRIISAALARKTHKELRNLIRLAKAGRFPAKWIRTYRPINNSLHS